MGINRRRPITKSPTKGLAAVADEDQPTETLVFSARSRRGPSSSRLKRQEEAQELTVKSYKGLTALRSRRSPAHRDRYSLDSLGPNWNVGATLSWPIFQGGSPKGTFARPRPNVSVAHAQLDAERLQSHA